MNVFVLGTGRCGTQTLARACEHFSNFTSAHESRASLFGPDRLAYPPRHIEADNRLSWMLGSLGRAYQGKPAFWVHLQRDRAAVRQSFARRWESTYRASIIRAFGHGITTRTSDYSTTEVDALCDHYIDVVTENIQEFLVGRPSLTIELERIEDGFDALVERIGAEGDLAAAQRELGMRHNASVPELD